MNHIIKTYNNNYISQEMFYDRRINMYHFIFFFSLFMIYSFAGWIIEIIFIGIKDKKFVDRGFLLGPYCPIYGIGGLIMTSILYKHPDNIFLCFLYAVIIGSILEYCTSYIMEKLFKARWWDYSNAICNINGRVCLVNSILFGLLGVILVNYINPFLYTCLNNEPTALFYLLTFLLLIIFIEDCILSFNIINKLKENVETIKKDYTEEMNKKVKDLMIAKSWSFKRLINAFPNLKFINLTGIKHMIKNQAKKLKDTTTKITQKRTSKN